MARQAQAAQYATDAEIEPEREEIVDSDDDLSYDVLTSVLISSLNFDR